MLLRFWQVSLAVRNWGVLHDYGSTGSLRSYTKENESRRRPKYLRRTLVEKTPGSWKEEQEPIWSQL